MTDDLRANLGAQRLAGEQKRHRHRFDSWTLDQDCGPEVYASVRCCSICGAIKDEQASRKGRSARKRGNTRELEIAKRLGGEKVGQYQGPEDVRTPLLNIQSKVRKNFPSWMTTELDRLPRTGGRLPALIVTDAPGRGHERQSIVVMHLADFEDLHGRAK